MSAQPSLYGIENSNRGGEKLWGKNLFNSNFPISLACYLRDQNIKPVYVSVDDSLHLQTDDDQITIGDLFGTDATGPDIMFDFESKFKPFEAFTFDEIPTIDLVTNHPDGTQLRPIEIKLTVLPDNSTYLRPQSQWGCELVVRPVSSTTACFSVVQSMIDAGIQSTVNLRVESTASSIQDLDNTSEISSRKTDIIGSLRESLSMVAGHQKPFLIQAIWKTEGKSHSFADKCFDIFVWSDLAIFGAILDVASRANITSSVPRTLRECVRTLQCVHQLSSGGKIKFDEIYRRVALNNQTDKAFSINGNRTFAFMNHPRLHEPEFGPEILREIILNGGAQKLSPERRLDAAIYFNRERLFK